MCCRCPPTSSVTARVASLCRNQESGIGMQGWTSTAFLVALRRAAHQLLDRPLVLDDPLALTILGAEREAALRSNPIEFDSGRLDSYLRAFVVARSRFAEDRLHLARASG